MRFLWLRFITIVQDFYILKWMVLFAIDFPARLDQNMSDNIYKHVSQREKPEKSEFSCGVRYVKESGETINLSVQWDKKRLGPLNDDWTDSMP